MSKIRILSAANDLGILKLFFQEGIILPSVKNDFEIFMQVQAQMSINGGKKTQAVKSVADRIGHTDDAVWKALARLA